MEEMKKLKVSESFAELTFVISLVFLFSICATTFGTDWYLSKKEASENRTLALTLEALTKSRMEKKIAMDTEKKEYLQTSKIADETIEDHIPQNGKYIAADLDNMRLFLYEDGELQKEYPILSKGKPGSFFETPGGNYEILAKTATHFSSVGEVYMPWSMQFHGNFFIHGWPYYPDGTPVAKGYSGGCIRLETPDAKEVYSFAQKNTPLFVYERSDAGTAARGALSLKNLPPPEVSALSYIVADVNTGEVFLEKNMSEELPIASLTKLMTAVVSNEAIMFDRKIAITAKALETFGDSGNLREGEVWTANDILYPLLMESSNDAAHALSLYYGENKFISLMNKKAKAIGMKNTSFEDASGISSENISTAYDLYILSRYLKNNKSFLLNITKIPSKKIASSIHEHVLRNFNVFSEDRGFLGGKTGYTSAAKETMISMFSLPVGEENHNVAFIVLGSQNREKDVRALISWFKEISNEKEAPMAAASSLEQS